MYKTYDGEASYISGTGILKKLNPLIPVKRPMLRIKLATNVVKFLFTKLEMDIFLFSPINVYKLRYAKHYLNVSYI